MCALFKPLTYEQRVQALALLVAALRYMPKGRGFDVLYAQGHFLIYLILSDLLLSWGRLSL
jgi:hypothetical protein